jgi:hypothetical protein
MSNVGRSGYFWPLRYRSKQRMILIGKGILPSRIMPETLNGLRVFLLVPQVQPSLIAYTALGRSRMLRPADSATRIREAHTEAVSGSAIFTLS